MAATWQRLWVCLRGCCTRGCITQEDRQTRHECVGGCARDGTSGHLQIRWLCAGECLTCGHTELRAGRYGSGMHEVMFRKDDKGEVRMWLRKSSQASNWLPEGDGYLVFKSLPTGPPAVAHAKKDREWKRSSVEATVREWYRYMTVTQEEAAQIRQSWEKRFDSLPPDGACDQLPPSEQLKWRALPRRARKRAEGPARSFRMASSTLENPPINPVTGPGRTSAQVEEDLEEYQSEVRLRASADEPTPVFQADYLFLQLPSKPVSLHRVCNGLFIEDATAEEISFSTLEFTTTKDTSHMGLNGDLVAAENSDYTQGKKGSTKTLRHHGVTRDAIKAYNVEVQTVRLPKTKDKAAQTVLRLTENSKQMLAKIDPDYEYIPARVPAPRQPQKQPRKKKGVAAEDEAADAPEHLGALGARARTRKRKQVVRDSSSDEDAHVRPSNIRCGNEQRGDEASGDGESSSSSSSEIEESKSADSSCVDSSGDADDEPPPIPDGFHIRPTWEPTDHIDAFMLWTALDTRGKPKWECFKVLKMLSGKRFSHDAHLFGRPREKRGVLLTEQMYKDNVFVPLMPGPPPDPESTTRSTRSNRARQHTCSPGGLESSVSMSNPKRAARKKVPFFCKECSSSADVLYCSPESVDGIIPSLLCSTCKPSSWVNISRSDFERVCAET